MGRENINNSARSPSYRHCNQLAIAYAEDNLCHWTCLQTSSFPERGEPKRTGALLSLGTSVSGTDVNVNCPLVSTDTPCSLSLLASEEYVYGILFSCQQRELATVCSMPTEYTDNRTYYSCHVYIAGLQCTQTQGPIIAVMCIYRAYNVHRQQDLLQVSCVYTAPTLYTEKRTYYSCHAHRLSARTPVTHFVCRTLS